MQQPSPATPAPARRQRVRPLAPPDRQAAIIEATVPLLRTFGTAVSTRQIAEAAGVAEGTIFRVFPDKVTLIHAAVARALDPAPIIAALRGIDPGLDLRERLRTAIGTVARRAAENASLMAAAREFVMSPPGDPGRHQPASATDHPGRHLPGAGTPGPLGHPGHPVMAELRQARRRVIDAFEDVLGPDAAQLRTSLRTAARLTFLTVFATAGPFAGDGETLDSDEITALLLDGLLRPACRATPPCAAPPERQAPDPRPDHRNPR